MDAKARLEALHQPIPRPTKAALAQNKAEEDSRREASTVSKVMGNFQKHPDVAQAARVGEPTLVDPQVVSATSVVQEATRAMMGGAAAGDKNSVAIETVGKGAPGPGPAGSAFGHARAGDCGHAGGQSAAPAADPNELTPNVAADPNELKPNVDNGAQTAPPPTQVNEIDPATSGQAAAGANDAPTRSLGSTADDKDIEAAMSSSKHKKKKGLQKVIPF